MRKSHKVMNDIPESSDNDTQVSDLEPINGESAIAEEMGGPKGLEPTRYGDWEKQGRCIDF